MSDNHSHGITSILKEGRQFDPPSDLSRKAKFQNLNDWRTLWTHSVENPEKFWADQAKETLSWFQPWSRVLDWQLPYAKWFVDAKLNVSFNCLDRHLSTSRRQKAAIIWEGEPGDRRILTYEELYREVCKCANALLTLGVKASDRVTIYLPLIPELAVAMLACARIGATHNVVFGGFSGEAIAERNNDAGAKLVITADGGWRRGQIVPLKANVDEALKKSPTIQKVLVVKRTGQATPMLKGRDEWWHEQVDHASELSQAVPLDSEHPLFLLYTSGSTGKPKGILHTTGGYLLYSAFTHKQVFDLKEDDIYWCTADVGWVTGHSYVVYGPLANGATTVMYEGAPSQPDWGRFWQIVDRYKISILYTAPTAIRAFIRQGKDFPSKYDLKSLRILGSVGEPINPEAWIWYRETIGGGRCPVVDTWWQTETGGIMISPLPGATPTVPGSATLPLFGVDPEIVDKNGKPVKANEGGFLVIKKPWPGMLRGIWGDDRRYKEQYWSQIPGVYFTGDGARRDQRGYFWIMGRIDDVLNVSGHRLSTMEIESALVSHPSVAEAAVVGAPHDLKGEAVHAFVTLKNERGNDLKSEALKKELSEHVVRHIGALARPEAIRFTAALPKTRSGKIMRRLLRDIAASRDSIGDTTTLEDLSILAQLRAADEE